MNAESPPEPTSGVERTGSRPPTQVRAAGVVVGLQGLVGVGFAVSLVARVGDSSLGLVPVLGEAGMFLVMGVVLILVGRGLLRGRFWARSPAVVVQMILLPVAYSLLVPSHQPFIGTVVAVVAAGTLYLLLSGAARTWSQDLDEERRQP
ncbi:hypothetical protein [Pseudonocardia spinosispora]|uniref:hypothetical protein n=1 Tax=Pseudonocardia spinosispora TaxID=103441 RepID=UPI0004285344|nr:hypothetical protein [Pseudonocardia spinosispora]